MQEEKRKAERKRKAEAARKKREKEVREPNQVFLAS
jgi:hypothetical protein